MIDHKNEISGRAVGLIPLVFFALIFLVFGFYTGSFYAIPVLVVFSLTSIFAFIVDFKTPLSVKIDTFCQGAGNKDIVLMILIFLLAGGFAEIAKASGAVDSAVSLGLFIMPSRFLILGLFLISLILSLAMGSSVGTIVALSPIAAGLAQNIEVSPAILAGSIIGGAMFGDNLSFISDTTIAACRTQQCEMNEKFKSNFFIVLPAAIVSLFFYLYSTSGEVRVLEQSFSFTDILSVIPYFIVLIMALLGVNVLIVLATGIVLTSGAGIFLGKFGFIELMQHVHSGLENMLNLSILSMLSGGLVSLIKLYGGIQYILNQVNKRVKGKSGAEFSISLLASLTDICTANNTVTIVMVGPMAKSISQKYQISSKRTASLLDIFSAGFQGIIPYGAQLLAAASILHVAPVKIMPYLYYPYLMIIAGVVSILWRKIKIA